MIQRTITLRSDHHFGRRIPPQALGRILDVIPDIARHSVRMAIEGRSQAAGKRPDWLRAASDIRFLGHDGADATVLHFEAPTLGEAAPRLYRQQELWPTKPRPDDSAFDIFADILADVTAKNADSERFDRPLLDRIAGFRRSLDRDFSKIEFEGRSTSGTPSIVTATIVDIARNLYANTPQPLRVRLIGKLDMLRSSTQSFGVLLDDNEEVRGVLPGGDIADISSLLGQRVLVLGNAVFRPSGKLLRVDAESVDASIETGSFFSTVPTPVRMKFDVRETFRDQQQKPGLAAIIGKWPGDETDEEIEQALKELS